MRKPIGTKTYTKSGIEVEYVGDVELPPEIMARVEAATRIADEEDAVCRVNFRWNSDALGLIKLVAAKIGVPYQTYIKQSLYKQALRDLKAMERVRNLGV